MHLQIPPFCIKTNLRENRLFVARLTVRDKQELFLHQFLSESCAYEQRHVQTIRQQPPAVAIIGMMLTANKNNLMRTQYIYYSVDKILEPTNVITLKSTEETE